MNIYQLIEKRRSIRLYKSDYIPQDVLNRVLEAARKAPSWANVQATRWIVVTEDALKAELVKALSPGNPSTKAITQAPVVLALCFVKEKSGFYKGQASTTLGDWGFFDAGLAAAQLTMAAVAEGLGTVHVGAIHVEMAAQILGVPENVQLVELIPLGYPDSEGFATNRLELNKIVSLEKYEEKK